MSVIARAAGTVLGGGAAAAVWGFGIERHLFAVRTHDLDVLPPGSPSLRVLHLSDAHMAPWQRRKQAWIAHAAERLQPDLVVNTGDNLGHSEGLAGIRRAFAPLHGVPGMFVHGSNDVTEPSMRNPFKYFSAPSGHVTAAPWLNTAAMNSFFTEDLGWTNLNNTAADIAAHGMTLRAFGVSDAHREWDRVGRLPGQLSALSPDPAFTLGVTHAPYRRVLDAFIRLGAEMIFAGHTHGGQVRIPFSPSALVANCDIPLDQARGLSTWTHQGTTVPLNVSAGLGQSIYAPVRFGCRPELSLITLRARR